MAKEIRRKLCSCGAWLTIEVTLPVGSDKWLENLSLSVPGQERTLNFFGKDTQNVTRRACYPFEFEFLFCLKCNRRHQVRTFKP